MNSFHHSAALARMRRDEISRDARSARTIRVPPPRSTARASEGDPRPSASGLGPRSERLGLSP